MKKLVFPFLSLLFISCSTDADVNFMEEVSTNNLPAISSTAFTIAEHSPSGTAIGTISASDADNDDLTFSIDTTTDILIDENTGDLTLGENLKLDFEAEENITFTVSAFDGKAITEASITLNIEDIIEYDALNKDQMAILNHFKHLALFQDDSSPTQRKMRKWDAPMKLFLDGTISAEFQTTVETVISEFNLLTATGDFNITLVNTEAESNAKLFFGAKGEILDVFPEMYQEIKDLDVDGYSRALFVDEFYSSVQIWISNPIDVLFKHELGHALGMGHSHKCDAPDPSVMCANIAQESAFLAIEEDVIRFFYHQDMPSGITADEIDFNLANLILLGD
jgi:hypothetical protein